MANKRFGSKRGSMAALSQPQFFAFEERPEKKVELTPAQKIAKFVRVLMSTSSTDDNDLLRSVLTAWLTEATSVKSDFEKLLRSRAFKNLTVVKRPSSRPVTMAQAPRHMQSRPASGAGLKSGSTAGRIALNPELKRGAAYRPGSSAGSRPGSSAGSRTDSTAGLGQNGLAASLPDLNGLAAHRHPLPSKPPPERLLPFEGGVAVEELLKMFRDVVNVGRGMVSIAWMDAATKLIRFHGVNVNTRDRDGVGMVHCLAKCKFFNSSLGASLAQLMVEVKANAHDADASGLTPLQLALKNGNSIVGRALLKHGPGLINQVADAQAIQWAEQGNEAWMTSIMVATAEDRESLALFQKWIQQWKSEDSPMEDQKRTQRTAKLMDIGPHGAVIQGHDTTVERLLANGADPCASLSDGTTVLHLAAKLDHTRILVILVRAKADIDALDDQHRTPLCVAAGSEAADSVETLLMLRANPAIYDQHGETPLIVATKRAREFRTTGAVESESIQLSRALRASRALRLKQEPWEFLEAELTRPVSSLYKDIELQKFSELCTETLEDKNPVGLETLFASSEKMNMKNEKLQAHLNQTGAGHRASTFAMKLSPKENISVKIRLAALIRKGFGSIDAPILGPQGFPALNDRLQLRSQLYEDNIIAQVISDKVVAPLMELLADQDLSDDLHGCKLKSFARYILGSGVVDLMKQRVSRSIISAESRISGVLNAGIHAATECLDALTPEVRGLVNSGQAWGELHQAHAHGESPVRWAQGSIAQAIGALLAVRAVDSPKELIQVIQKRLKQDRHEFGKEGSFWRFTYALWLQTLARKVDASFQEKMQALAHLFIRRNRDVIIHKAKHYAGPIKSLDNIVLRQGQYLDRTKKLYPLFGDRLAAGGVCDISRCSLTFDTPEQIRDCFNRLLQMNLRDDGAEAVMYRNRFHPKAVVSDPLTAITVNVAVPVPLSNYLHLCEVQLHLTQAIDAKRSFHLLKAADLGHREPTVTNFNSSSKSRASNVGMAATRA